jgi:phosphoglycerate dehydrogenase-like enzyme
MRILALDGIHADGLNLFRNEGWFVETGEPIKDPAALAAKLKAFDAVLVRSATLVGADALVEARDLKVIGRAGAGVDTIDVEAATARGIAVMKRPTATPSPRPSTRSRCCSRWRGISRAPTPA